MKKYIPLLILVFLIAFGSRAQTFSDDNYIYTVTPKKPVQTAGLNALTKDEKNQSITYFDGLGRPVQTIAIGQGGDGKDIITPVEYDVFGRQIKEYLPYASQNGGDNYARIDPATAINDLTGFYGGVQYDNTTKPFSQKKLEASPLNRVLRQSAPGDSWAMDSGHEIKMDYQTNTADEVRWFRDSTTWDAGLGLFKTVFLDEGNYAANQLYKTITYDENTTTNPSESSGSTVEFKNKEGQVVLKRTYNSGDKHDTYYVYDMYGNLSYVLPPKVTGVVSNDVLNGLCYQYKYDHRNRLVEKKLPGKQWEYIVYDKLDRPVATGPAFSPFKDETAEGWLITKYDGFGRPVYTGWSGVPPGSANRKSLQDEQNTATVLYETRGYVGTIDDNITIHYSNANAPLNFKLLTVTYYDDYDYPNAPVRPVSIEDQTVLDNTKGLVTGSWTRALTTSSETLGETTTTFYDTKARAISTRTQNHLGGYTNIDNSLDFTGKSLYSITKHKRTSGDTELTVKEEFTYSPQDRLVTHTHQVNGGTVEVLANNTYDDLGQLIVKNVGNNATSPLQKVHYSYNIRGWLTGINNVENLQKDTDPVDLFAFKINYEKQPGNTQVLALYNGNISETTWKTNTDVTKRSYGYQYDNLNRLTSAIYSKPNDAIPASGAYNESLSYDKNGNIKSLQRYGASDAPSIVFQIDDLTYGYLNENSNQLTKVTDSPAGNDNEGFKDGNKAGDDFTYDANGNMITDKNKNITEIQYNQLNLPKKITFGTSGSIEYIYNASGQKLEKIVTVPEAVVKTDYLGGFQYNYINYGGQVPDDPGDTDPPIDTPDPVIDPPVEASRSSLSGGPNVVSRPTLQFFPTAEGYYDNVYQKYVYHYKDHLGNIRLSYDKNPVNNALRIVEESNYYPFGLKHKGYNMDDLNPDYKYKYNGKELQDDNVGMFALNLYDYGARNYDAAIGRWMNIDPLAEKYTNISPYVYVANNPLRFIDPNGMEIINGETARRERLQKLNDGYQNRIKEKYNGNLELSKKDFASKEDYKEYKSDLRNAERTAENLKESIAIEAKIQTSIDDFAKTDPTNFKLANNLTFKDGNGIEHNLDVTVKSGNEYENGGAATRTGYEKKSDGTYKSITSITTTMDYSVVKPVSYVLAHEMGHAYNISQNPNQSMLDTNTHNCQDPANRNTFQSKTAMDWQENYTKLKTSKPSK